MREYKILTLILFSLIIGSQSLPRNRREESSNDTQQSDRTLRETETSGHVDIVNDKNSTTLQDGEVPLPRNNFSAEGKGYNCIDDVCEMAHDYPYDHIEKVVSALYDKPNSEGDFVGNTLENGAGVGPKDPDTIHLCEVFVHATYPKVMQNDYGVQKYIVNTETHRQGVIYEICMSGNIDRLAFVKEGFDVVCYQKHSTVQLLAIEADETGNPVYEEFMVPSGCVSAFTH